MKKRKFKEWLSLMVAKKPAAVILGGILLLNMVFFLISAVIISNLAPSNVEDSGFWASVFYTVTMILDAGCISFVVADVGSASVALIICCIVIVILGSITFTGAVIGYVTNYISDFIMKSNSGERALSLSGHTVILNWNNRASEIINDMLYSSKVETVVVLTPNGRDSIEREINERLAGTIEAERGELAKLCIGKTAAQKREIIKKNKIKNRVNVLVREGDTFSTKKLNDISIMRAKSIVILADDMKSTVCQYEKKEYIEKREKGNTATIKTLIQVAEMTGRAESADNQIIVVEVNDNWTQYLVSRIINHKQIAGKCHIVPIMVSKTLGQILSQFAIMPELNSVYGELFSNKGAQFFSRKMDDNDSEEKHVRQVMDSDCTAIPLAALEDEGGRTFYYLANSDRDVNELVQPSRATLKGGVELKLKENFWLEKRNVIILGHNSRMEYLMEGFNAFASEWNFSDEKLIEENGGKNILNIVIVDEQSELERQDYMNRYEAVTKVVAADAYDREQVCSALNEFIDSHDGDTSVLILSDDMVGPEEVDANPLTYLVYVQDIIAERRAANPDFDSESIDVIVEIINPKNYDIVHSYSVDNIVISNRYISKMLTQIGEKDDIYKFYCDILTYDDNNQVFESKEMYIKKVSRFFTQIPGKCTAAQLIRAVYNASPADNRSIVCGYVRKGGQVVIFSGNQENIPVMLCETDKLIIFSNH